MIPLKASIGKHQTKSALHMIAQGVAHIAHSYREKYSDFNTLL